MGGVAVTIQRYRMDAWGAPATPCASEEPDDAGGWVRYEDASGQLALLREALALALKSGMTARVGKIVCRGCQCYDEEHIDIPQHLRDVFAEASTST